MNIGLGQIPLSHEREEIALSILKEGISRKLDIIALPEMWLTGFNPYDTNLVHSEAFLEQVLDFSKNCNSIIIPGSFPEREKDRIFNTAFVVHKGEIIHKRRKLYPFEPMGETKYFAPGDYPKVLEINNIRVGIAICYELRFPDIFLSLMLQEPDIVIVVAQWPINRVEHWQTLLKARAIEGQYFVAGVNIVGEKGKLVFPGCSSIYHPLGNLMMNAEDKMGLFTCKVDLEETIEYRKAIPVLKDIKRAKLNGVI